MKGILLLNGEPYAEKINDECATVYCCDGAYAWAKDKLRIDKNIGDFDSLPYMPTPPPEKIYPTEKDSTDGEIAINKMIADGITDIEIYGGGGGREDHFLGNLQLLYLALKRGVKAVMINNNSTILAASGVVELGEFVGKTISVLPFGATVHIIEGTGFKYPYPEKLCVGECRGISNIVKSPNAHLVTADGEVALIIINRGNV